MPGPWDDYAPPAKAAGPWDDYAAAPTEKPFLEKLSNFWSKIQENPPPSIAAARDIIKGAPAAATELTWGADPEAAEQAAGTIAQAAGMGLSFKGPGGTNVGVAGRPIARPGTIPALPLPPALGPSAGDVAVEAAGRLPGNVAVPKYLATDTTLAPRVATGLSQVPFSGQPVVRSAEELTAGLGRAKGEIAGGIATPETAGERARSALESFTTTRSQQPVSKAYQAVDELIDPNIRVPLTNTADLVAEMNARRANANIPGTSRAADIVSRAIKSPLDEIPPELQAGILRRNPELATSPSMDYAGIKDLRTYLRSKTPQQLITEGIDPTEAKRILGGLTKDLENVVSQSGPEALSAWREANALASRTARERKALTRTIGLQGNASPEQVFNRLLAYAGSKSSADIGRLRLAKQAMGPEAWKDVGSAMINRMGMAPDGAFSPDRFVTAFGNMSGAAKQQLFSGQQAAALSDLFLVSKHVQDRVTRLANPSGTARNTIPFAIAAHLLADPITAIASIVGQRMLAEALSRPAMVRAATAVSRASLSGNPVAIRRALTLLGQIAVREQLVGGANQSIERRQAGGPVEERQSYLVGERGPEVFVPDDPWARAAARTGRRGRREGAGTAFVEGGYGIPAAYRSLDEGARRAMESAGALQHYGDEYYDPAPVVQQAIGAVGAPLVGPAQTGVALGAGAIRRAKPGLQTPAIRNPDAPLFDYSKLREVPDVPQTNLQRYEAPRGVPERTQALAAPENVARVNEVVKRGAQQGGIEWYNTDPLRQAFLQARGPEGEAAYRQYLDLVASTSPRSNVGVNARNAAYYYGLAQRGEPLPEVIAKGGALSVKEPLPSPYGHIAQGLHAQNARNVLEGGGWPVLQNPKPASFVENLAGNQMPVTVDTHNARLWGMTDTKGRPVDKPAKTEYGFMERLQQDEARKLGMTPAQYQASAWIGGGEQTGLRSSADPFLKVLEDRIRLTAAQTGENPRDVLHRFLMGQNAPGQRGPLLSVAPPPVDTNRRD